ncbi:calcium-binding protein [Mangrovicoccus algicola]|uniref:calcium-binding protein n=1 Tax=Mangrovicoccus algicola TaxID=2771008 RepID=UPI00186934FE
MTYSVNLRVGDFAAETVRLHVRFSVTYSEAPFPETLVEDPAYGDSFGYIDYSVFNESLTLGNYTETVVELTEGKYGVYNDPDEPSDWVNGSPDGDWTGSDYYKTSISGVYTFPTDAYLEWRGRDWQDKYPGLTQTDSFWRVYYISGEELSRIASPEPYNLITGPASERHLLEAQLYLEDVAESVALSPTLYQIADGYRSVPLDPGDPWQAEYEIPYLAESLTGAALMLMQMHLADRGRAGLADLTGTVSAIDALAESLQARFIAPRLDLIGLFADADGTLADHDTIEAWEAANALSAASLLGFVTDNAPAAGLALGALSLVASGGDSGEVLHVFGAEGAAAGTGGSDRGIFGAGDDVYDGGAGRDYLSGHDGRDRLFGGADRDWLLGGNGADTLKGGQGRDELRGGNGWDRLSGGIGNDTLSGQSGHDRLSGEDGADRLWGGNGNDLLEGGSGADRLFGGARDDRLFGNAGQDRLYGGSGRDRLDGGIGSDTMTGGSGADSFVFSAALNAGSRDVIADFGTGADRLLIGGFRGDAGDVTDRAKQQGDDVLIAFDNGAELLLRDIALSALEGRIDLL